MRHIEATFLYLQQLVAEKVLVLGTVKSEVNPSDLGTKHHQSERLRMLKARCMLAPSLAHCLGPAGEMEDISHWSEVLSLELIGSTGAGGDANSSSDLHIFYCLLALVASMLAVVCFVTGFAVARAVTPASQQAVTLNVGTQNKKDKDEAFPAETQTENKKMPAETEIPAQGTRMSEESSYGDLRSTSEKRSSVPAPVSSMMSGPMLRTRFSLSPSIVPSEKMDPETLAQCYYYDEVRATVRKWRLPTSGTKVQLVTRLLAAGWRPQATTS